MMPNSEVRVGHVLDLLAEMPARSVHLVCTSPPYWGHRDYKGEPQLWGGGAWRGQLGLEPTVEAYVDHLVETFDAVKRVLRDDGSLFVILGDTYATGAGKALNPGGGAQGKRSRDAGLLCSPNRLPENGLQAGDLCLIPARFGLAMQAAGWIVRQTVIWAKAISFGPSIAIHHAGGVDDEQYSGSTMPESLAGVRWERCRVKISPQQKGKQPSVVAGGPRSRDMSNGQYIGSAEWSPCPGCPKCKAHDGLVLKRGSWRPTKSHETVFQIVKRPRYYSDGFAVEEKGSGKGGGSCFGKVNLDGPGSRRHPTAERAQYDATRNLRAVWAVSPIGFPGAHFATYPPRLIEPIVKLATSEAGVCPDCGAPWARVVERETLRDLGILRDDRATSKRESAGVQGLSSVKRGNDGRCSPKSTTLGWRPTCDCPQKEAIPATVLDPFDGAGTTRLVARQLGRASIGLELNPEYAAISEARLGAYSPLFADQAEA